MPADHLRREPGSRRVPADANFAVRITLPADRVTRQELEQEAPGQYRGFDPHVDRDSVGRAVLTLRVMAADLWTAVLVAMNVVTQTGHGVERIEASPVAAERG